MKYQIGQVRKLWKQLHRPPVVYAGDIFNTWNEPAECINFALQVLPPGYAIPGQHDMPYHNYKELGRSAFWTLCEAGRIREILPGAPLRVNDHLVLHGFPWGADLKPCDGEQWPSPPINLAVVHKYIWIEGHSYPGAPESARLKNVLKSLSGYDAIVSGDNHRGWLYKTKYGMVVFNCGGLMRRKIDEMSYQPRIGVLYRDGVIEPYYLECSEDKFIDVNDIAQAVGKLGDVKEFVVELAQLGDSALNFVEVVKRYLADNSLPKTVASMLLRALEERKVK